MNFPDSVKAAIHDLAVEMFGPEIAVYLAAEFPDSAPIDDPDFVIVVPDRCATLADELALADALETNQPGVQPVVKLIARSNLAAEGARQ